MAILLVVSLLVIIVAGFFVTAELFPVASDAQDVISPGVTLFSLHFRVQGHATVLAFKTRWVEIFSQCSEPRHRLFSRFGYDGLFAVGALDGLFHVVVLFAVNVHFVVGDEGFVRHLFSALDAGEAARMKAPTGDADDFAAADFVSASRATLAVGLVMLLAQNLVADVEVGTDDHRVANTAFFSTILEVDFANWFSIVNEILSPDSFPANLTLATFRVIRLFGQLHAVPLDRTLAHDASLLHFRVAFGAIWQSTSLEKLSLDFLLAGAAFEALFVINFTKSCASFVRDCLVALLALAYGLVYGFRGSVPDFGLDGRVLEVRISRDGPAQDGAVGAAVLLLPDGMGARFGCHVVGRQAAGRCWFRCQASCCRRRCAAGSCCWSRRRGSGRSPAR